MRMRDLCFWLVLAASICLYGAVVSTSTIVRANGAVGGEALVIFLPLAWVGIRVWEYEKEIEMLRKFKRDYLNQYRRESEDK